MRRNLALAFFAATTLISSSVNAQTAPVVLDDSVPAVSYYSALISGADQPGVGVGIQFRPRIGPQEQAFNIIALHPDQRARLQFMAARHFGKSSQNLSARQP